MGREVAGSCIDYLIMEMASAYSSRFYATKPDLAGRRIEAIGFQVGHQLVERYTMERPRFNDHLEVIKYICKDFWTELFKKQVDNLKTNHKGTFVLQDNMFRWLTHLSINSSEEKPQTSQDPPVMSPEKKAEAEVINMHLYFPCGIIRGALSNLGIPCAVSAEISTVPACSFVVRIKA